VRGGVCCTDSDLLEALFSPSRNAIADIPSVPGGFPTQLTYLSDIENGEFKNSISVFFEETLHWILLGVSTLFIQRDLGVSSEWINNIRGHIRPCMKR
jgi:hypothetical protein